MGILAQKSYITPLPEFIRGGRLRKTSKGLISFAPFLGASVLALGAMLATSLSVEAGMCTSENDDGVYVCSGIADSDNDMTQNLSAGSGEALMITSGSDFGIQSSGDAFYLQSIADSTSMNIHLSGSGDIVADDLGFYIYHRGTGNAYINVD